MKTGFVIVALTAGMLAVVMTGASLAGDARTAGMADLNSVDPERAVGDSWQVREPIETGALPVVSGSRPMTGGMASDDAGVTLVEFGGVQYRVGLDTGP